MEIYLVRHTTPDIEKGVCYGQADIDVTDSFFDEASIIQNHLPKNITAVHSSPLQRCKKLAAHLFPKHAIELHNDLKEINCGGWELKKWDDIPKPAIDPWMNDFVNVRIPGGESYVDLYERVTLRFTEIIRPQSIILQKVLPPGEDLGGATIIVAHGGVIRSILSHITATALVDSFNIFSLHYGCVIKICVTPDGLQHEVLSNIAHAKETHKPSYL